MPYKTYQCRYPNEVHQLIVSVSKHFCILKGGQISHQKKPFEVNLLNYGKSSKLHVVHYLIRDHFSGAFYGEVSPSSELLSLDEFLYRAWSRKEEYAFCGIPEFVIVPNTVITVFPGVVTLLNTIGVRLEKATSGFHAGIRDVRTWEDHIKYYFWKHDGSAYFKNLQKVTLNMSANLCSSYDDKKSKINIWRNNLKSVTLPPADKEAFLAAYVH